MPGDMTLGCLLGQYDRAFSFDVDSAAITSTVNSWAFASAQGSGYYQTSDVRSSGQGLKLEVYSGGSAAALMSYNHGYADDAYERWWTGITTHDLRLDGWARIDTAGNSGDFTVRLATQANADYTVPQNAALQSFRLATYAHSAAAATPSVALRRGTSADSYAVYLDSLLIQVDPISLFPQWDFLGQAALLPADHQTAGGLFQRHTWGEYQTWELSLRYLPDSHATLLAFWWANRFPLVYTENTSDAATVHVVRITNPGRPCTQLDPPYFDRWRGMLTLESLTSGGLVY